MNVDLTREDLITLVRGTSPEYALFTELENLRLGKFTGGFSDRWDWAYYSKNLPNPEWDALTEQQLWQWYQRIKHSWDN